MTAARGTKRPAAARGRTATKAMAKSSRANGKATAVQVPHGETAAESPEWRRFVGRWLETHQCKVEQAPRGDWEVELSHDLQKRWRRQRVRMVFDPTRPTVPRGAWLDRKSVV